MNNPLLDFSDLPQFSTIAPKHVGPAIDQLLAENRQLLARLESDTTAPTWKNFVAPLEDGTEKLSRAWGIVSHLHAVVDTPELRKAYNDNQPKVTEFWTALSQNPALYGKYKALAQSAAFAALSPTRQRIVEHTLRDFRLGGAELTDSAKKRFAEVAERLAELSTRFSENVLDATNDFAVFVTDATELEGIPEDDLHAARAAAERDDKPGYKLTLHFPSYYPVMQYATNRSLREKLYRAYVSRASDLGEMFSRKADWDNGAIMVETLRLRGEEARLLDYAHFADVSLVPKMADSPREVIDFLENLSRRARPHAERDLVELREFARTELQLDTLEAWDIPYASEKLRQQRYAFSDHEVRQYFPEHKAVEGLFHVAQTLFSVEIKPDTAPLWHPDVRFFRIEKNGKLIGQFYLDLYAREGKRGGAWMDDARNRKRRADGSLQTPVAYLNCNFSAPVVVDGVARAALFTHDDVTTLFHEFGHGLHHLLTEIDDLAVAGINGVEWDAVELPSQFMENFCWEWQVLEKMTAHCDTGAPLPRTLFDKMIAAKNFQSGLQMLRQIEFSLFDMLLHGEFSGNDANAIQALLDGVRSQVAVLTPPPYNRFQNTFSHIFSGGYAAGYYSYKWAEVLSADAFGAFEEAAQNGENILSPGMGERFRAQILARGGSRDAAQSFEAFRGRKQRIDALLRHNGMNP